MEKITVFAFDRDHTVDVNQGPVPLEWIRKLARQEGNEVWATGNQALKEEAGILGTKETAKRLSEDPSNWGRRQRVRRLEKLYPNVDRYVVVDDVDLSDLEKHGWKYYNPQEFVKEYSDRLKVKENGSKE